MSDLLRQIAGLDDAAQERLEDAIEDVRHELRLEVMVLRARVAMLEKALRDLRDCFTFHSEVDEGRPGMVNWWTTKGGTGWGTYEDCGVPITTVQAIRVAEVALGEPVSGEEPSNE